MLPHLSRFARSNTLDQPTFFPWDPIREAWLPNQVFCLSATNLPPLFCLYFFLLGLWWLLTARSE